MKLKWGWGGIRMQYVRWAGIISICAVRWGRLLRSTALHAHPQLYCPAPLQELKTKKRYGRLQKAMGDHCLLAGSPLDAQDHYSTGGQSFSLLCQPVIAVASSRGLAPSLANNNIKSLAKQNKGSVLYSGRAHFCDISCCAAAELGRTAQDWIYLAAALEGFASAKVLNAAITNGAFAINQSRWVLCRFCWLMGINLSLVVRGCGIACRCCCISHDGVLHLPSSPAAACSMMRSSGARRARRRGRQTQMQRCQVGLLLCSCFAALLHYRAAERLPRDAQFLGQGQEAHTALQMPAAQPKSMHTHARAHHLSSCRGLPQQQRLWRRPVLGSPAGGGQARSRGSGAAGGGQGKHPAARGPAAAGGKRPQAGAVPGGPACE